MLRVRNRGCLLLSLLCLSAGALAGTARVNFVNPQQFTDIGRFGDSREAANHQAELARHLEQLAARKLPADCALEVDVLDVNLAGLMEPRPFWHEDIRVMSRVTWPSIKLRYRLKQGERVLASGQETVADMNYLDRPNSYRIGDSLRYEKRMLDDWFDQRLVERRPAL